MRNNLDISGHITLEGSKSILNRVLIIASYLDEPLIIRNPSTCFDIRTMADNLSILGMKIDRSNEIWSVTSPGKLKQKGELSILDSGTALRFLTARIAAIDNSEFTINVSDQLRRRPIKSLNNILKKMGSKIETKKDSLIIKGSYLEGGVFELPADISSQFISSLLLIAPSYKNDVEIILKSEIVSKPYIKMTINIMHYFGLDISFNGERIFIRAGQKYNNIGEYYVEPDYSSACYFWALGALSRSVVSTNTINTTSLQPDYKFLTILINIGTKIEIEKDKICVSHGKLKGISVDMRDMPDQVPTLAVLALFADSKTTITNIEHLKYKESNRIEALITELSRIGADINYKNGTLTINPLNHIPEVITLGTYNDHRLVMAFHILKILFPQISINNSSSVDKSYPNFLDDVKSL